MKIDCSLIWRRSDGFKTNLFFFRLTLAFKGVGEKKQEKDYVECRMSITVTSTHMHAQPFSTSVVVNWAR